MDFAKTTQKYSQRSCYQISEVWNMPIHWKYCTFGPKFISDNMIYYYTPCDYCPVY